MEHDPVSPPSTQEQLSQRRNRVMLAGSIVGGSVPIGPLVVEYLNAYVLADPMSGTLAGLLSASITGAAAWLARVVELALTK